MPVLASAKPLDCLASSTAKSKWDSSCRIDAIERFTRLHPVTDPFEDVDTRAAIKRRAERGAQAERSASNRPRRRRRRHARGRPHEAGPAQAAEGPRPCVSMIFCMEVMAAPLSSNCRARSYPAPPRTAGSHSITRAASSRDFSRRSAGAEMSFASTAMTSRASSTGPIPRPTGCAPSVTTISRWIFMRSATNSKSLRRRIASVASRTFAVGPSGKSITKCVEPADFFFDMMEATISLARVEVQRTFDTDQNIVGR